MPIFSTAIDYYTTVIYFYTPSKSKPFEMKNRFVQLTHRYPALEYFFSFVSFFMISFLLVLLLIVVIGLLSGS